MPAKKTTREDSVDVLSVGIDLGTSRSVVSASNGNREWVESFVGWPKDFVAKKTLGKRVLFGEEALEHRLSVQLIRPLANGVIKRGTARDMESVKELIGHLLELARPASGQRIHAAVGIPAEALRINHQDIKAAVSRFADRLIVVSEPFSVAYGLNTLDNAMVIDIGAGTVDFCIMHGAMPGEDDQRSLVTAGDYVDQQLHDLLVERYPRADFTLNMVRRCKEKYGFVGAPTRKVEVEVPVRGRMVSHDITQEMRRACESIMPAIVETVAEMIARFDPEFQERVRRNILVAGGGSQIRGIGEYLTEEVARDFAPCRFSCVDDPLYVGADGALGLAEDMPAEYWENISQVDN